MSLFCVLFKNTAHLNTFYRKLVLDKLIVTHKELARLIIMRILTFISLTLFIFSCNNETIRKEGFEVHGIDVSRYQSDINWNKVANQDITFAFVKASEGETISDNFFCKNWKEMKEAGIRRGAYHFFRPTTSVLTQAQNCLLYTSPSPRD